MTDTEDTFSAQLEVVPPSALEAITRGEIDVQITTAKRYPRSLERFKKTALAIVTLDEETAASCLYCRPVGKEKDPATGRYVEKYAKGMSVRMAEIVGSCFGNMRVGAMVTEQTPEFVKGRGFAHDLETNFACSSEVIESTVTKDGKPYSARMRVTIAKACVAKARRDAIFQVVPKALAKFLETAARAIAVGDASTLSDRRARIMEWIAKLGVSADRVFAALNIGGESEIGLDQIETLTGLKTAIKEESVTIDEAFPGVASKPSFEPKKVRGGFLPKTEPKTETNLFGEQQAPAVHPLAELREWLERAKITFDECFQAALELMIIGDAFEGGIDDLTAEQCRAILADKPAFLKVVEAARKESV